MMAGSKAGIDAGAQFHPLRIAVLTVSDTRTGDTDTSGALLARIAEQNCYGTAKLELVEAWMTRQGLKREDCHIRFYSDHVSDAPCLNWADEAFATNAHAPLMPQKPLER